MLYCINNMIFLQFATTVKEGPFCQLVDLFSIRIFSYQFTCWLHSTFYLYLIYCYNLWWNFMNSNWNRTYSFQNIIMRIVSPFEGTETRCSGLCYAILWNQPMQLKSLLRGGGEGTCPWRTWWERRWYQFYFRCTSMVPFFQLWSMAKWSYSYWT
jgi:hypothetical protein